ncbi:MAG: type I-E CRISPR-associated protein Cas7/Cse4/CasC [Candidatus Fermentibacteraceae bacterium]|nr:type I-E CRISPR-associated protein Cas7/Cse4/CasC [Candidatus Fermentibacteraceae bacterium]
MKNEFLQIHTLISYPAVLLNRDDAGFAKRITFGGVSRTRISSQCLKRHWRTYSGKGSLGHIEGTEMSIRSRMSFNEFVLKPLLEESINESHAAAVVQALMAKVLGESKKAEKSRSESTEESVILQTSQVTVLGRPELRFLLDTARDICIEIDNEKEAKKAVEDHFKKESGKNLKGLRQAAGLDAAMFGRMVTSDILSRGDAAIHVAHAFTVHCESSESDYFSAVDDLIAAEGELGSGHINSVELNSGLYYGYVVIDMPLLVSNLEGCDRKDWTKADRSLAAEIVRRLISIIATVSPGAKLGSTAPHSYAQMVLLEAGEVQPRTLANAFLEPVSETPNLLENAYSALGRHISELDHAYGENTDRRLMCLGPAELLKVGDSYTLDELTSWAADWTMGSK